MKNLVEMFKQRCTRDPDKTAFLVKKNGKWNPVTWSEVDEKTDKIAAALINSGLKSGESVAILGNTRLEWTLSDVGVLKSGGVSIGIYQTLSGDQSAYILKDSNSKILFIENPTQLEKINPHLADLPDLRQIVMWDGCSEGMNAISMEEFMRHGAQSLDTDSEIVGKTSLQIQPSDVAVIIYTSGTTGPPKGVCLTHKNLLAELKTIDLIEDRDVGNIMMFFLPLSHVGERVAQYMRIRRGIQGAYVDDITKILDDIREIRPTFFGSVPRIFEKAYARIRSEVNTAPPIKQKIFSWAEGVGRAASRKIQDGQQLPLGLKMKYALADRLVFSKVRDVFGGRVRYFLSSAAPIAVEILEFFHACGMVILEGYGQSEVSCFCTLCTPEAYRFGSVGKALPGVSLKIAEDGEIMVKGDIVFQGYLNQPDLNRQTLTDDGWIFTGDIGEIDKDGFLWVTGRKKDIIITSGGKNVTPSNIENLLLSHPLIEYAMVHGDRRKYLTALISLSPDNLPAWSQSKGIENSDYETLTRHATVNKEIQAAVDSVNKRLANFETIKKFVIIPKTFEVESGELTPTMKVRRRVVEEKYMVQLDGLYAD
ncbi:MAG: long-chain fatty acid--CoA ligase [Desulfobacteraceae bacterium]|nr:long-chain fatty acid--CoA ligase [Desulfobacteraceae bacterium]MBC2757397.1 long-chain fatty acid--CoA ligase [Desulfobacteraceae bacterium]